MSNSILKLEKVNKSYKDNKKSLHIIKDLDLDVKEGEFISILGKSGSGKSTLLNLMCALDSIDSGEIIYAGKKMSEQSDVELTKMRSTMLGFVFQFHYLLPEFTSLENVMLPAMFNNKLNKKELLEKAKKLLEEVELGHRLNHKPNELSGGEKQRVAIARSLINDPKILFADEPTGNLDEETSEVIHNILRKINKEKNLTIIVVTHSQELASVCDKKIYLKRGKLER